MLKYLWWAKETAILRSDSLCQLGFLSSVYTLCVPPASGFETSEELSHSIYSLSQDRLWISNRLYSSWLCCEFFSYGTSSFAYSLTCAKSIHESTLEFSGTSERTLCCINMHCAVWNPTNQWHRCQETTQESSGILYSNFPKHFRTFWLNLHKMHPSFLFPVTHIRLFLVFLCRRLPALDRSKHAVLVACNQGSL